MINRKTREPGTNKEGNNWPLQIKVAVWGKAFPIKGYDPDIVRTDICGDTIKFEQYGNRDSSYGWEIDHVIPIALGGGDNLENLQPLHWANNVKKGEQLGSACK